jgi:hypothetical protein
MATAGEKIEHPSWCDRSVCTAPETRPSVVDFGEGGEHRSATVALSSYTEALGLEFYVSERVAPWDTAPFLRVQIANGQLSWMSEIDRAGFDLFALLAKPIGEMTREYPLLYAEQFGWVADAMFESD